jgi:predicted O-methyltransferase YrrM
VGAAQSPPPTFRETLLLLGDVTGFPVARSGPPAVGDRTRSLPPQSSVVEIGSYFGKSTILLGAAAGEDVDVVAIDPHASGPYVSATDEEGRRVHEAFHANLRRAGVADRVRHVRRPSQSAAALDEVRDAVDVLYIDGNHRYGRARDDLRLGGSRVRAGGSPFVHDCYSSPYVTAAVLRVLGLHRGFRYVRRERTLVEYVAQPLHGLERLGNLVRQLLPLGWFARNIAIKLAIKSGRPRIARRLRHREPGWPY